jgi:mono/diheme cytochrome c family protein
MRVPILIAASVSIGCFSSAARAADIRTGEAIFQGACATCHAAGSPRAIAGQPSLPRTDTITGNNPTSAILIILRGHFPPSEQRGPWMPAYATTLNDAQIADVLNFLRQTAHQAPWPDLAQRVQAMRAKSTEAQ